MTMQVERKFGYMKDIDKPGGYAPFGKRLIPTDIKRANLISSELGDGKHAPCIDLDVPHQVVPSTTPGHGHLYIDVPMSWRRYKRLLRALYKAGVIEKGYYTASVDRKASYVRKPGHYKVSAKEVA
jgi:hypothetical protein